MGLTRPLSARESQSLECLSQQLLGAERKIIATLAQLVEHTTHLSLGKAQVAQRREDLGVSIERARIRNLAVKAAISVSEAQRAGRGSVDEELAAVGRPMVHATQGQEVRSRVRAALGPGFDVMQIEEVGILAARHAATVLIAMQGAAAQGVGNGLLGTRAHVGLVAHSLRGAGACGRSTAPSGARRVLGTGDLVVLADRDVVALIVSDRVVLRNVPELLRITARHGHDRCVDSHALPARNLSPAAAAFAHAQRYLVTRPPFVAKTPQYGARHGQKRRVVVEARDTRPPQLTDRFAKQRKRLGSYLEAQHVPARLGMPRVIRHVTRDSARDEGLDQTGRRAPRHLQPGGFGVRGDHARVSSRTADQLSAPLSSA